ncbi:MAG: hypothetical protein ABSA52_19775 [Candidatus Binatia bacterium]|jgi:hypothetical protein
MQPVEKTADRPEEITEPRGSRLLRSWGGGVVAFASRFVRNNWKVVLYVLLIVLSVVFAPEQPLKFIYTEF